MSETRDTQPDAITPDPAMEAASLADFKAGNYQTSAELIAELKADNAAITGERLEAAMSEDGHWIAHDNCDPPQLWVWAGERDESAEPIRRVREPEATRIAALESDLAALREQVADYDSALAEFNYSTGPEQVRTLGRRCKMAIDQESALREQNAALTQQLADKSRECDQLRSLASKQAQEIENLNCMADAVEALRDIGRATGCNHVDDPDGRRKLVNCVEQTIDELREQLAAARGEREEARKAARWMLPFLVNLPHHLRTAVEGWPWLDETLTEQPQ